MRRLAGCLAELHEQGRGLSNASTAVAAARFRARLAGGQSPAGARTALLFAGYRGTAAGRGRGWRRPRPASPRTEFRNLVRAARAVIAERVGRGIATPAEHLTVAALDEMPDEDDPDAVRA